MNETKLEQIQLSLEEKRERRTAYIERERTMLTGGVQSYGIGGRNLARYNTDLAQIRSAIKELDEEIRELEGLLNNDKPRKRVGMVFHDRW